MFDELTMFPMLPAADLARARAWYATHLGVQPAMEFPEQEFNVYRRFISYKSQFAGTAKSTAATWVATDFEVAAARLREAGVQFETYDMPELTWTNGIARGPDGTQVLWFKDSEGNILSLMEQPPGVARE